MSSPLAALRLKNLRAHLSKLENELPNRINHAQVLRRSGGSIEPRNLQKFDSCL